MTAVCTGDRPVAPTRPDPLDLDWAPLPGLTRRRKAERALFVREGWPK